LSPWGKKKEKTEEVLEETKALILKIKKKGIDTHQAEKLYKEAKKAVKSRNYVEALEGLELAEKSAKRAYARGIKMILDERIAKLTTCVKELQSKKLAAKRAKKLLLKAQSAVKSGVKGYKTGLSSSKEGLAIAEKQLERHTILTDLLSSTSYDLRRMEDKNPGLSILPPLSKKLAGLEVLKSQGKVETALKDAKSLNREVSGIKERHKTACEVVQSFEKVVKDVKVLGANIEAEEQLKTAKNLLLEGKFAEATNLAEQGRETIAPQLTEFREAQHHVDLAETKVSEAKGWGFSAYEADSALKTAQEALRDNRFEEAISQAKTAHERASNIRERHKSSMDLITKAKEEITRLQDRGEDVSEIELRIQEAEDVFYKGDYSASDEKVKFVLDDLKYIG
jgi:hypothetical protein